MKPETGNLAELAQFLRETHPEPSLVNPDKFDGATSDGRSFLTQCQLAFSLQPTRFPSDAQKVAYIIGLMKGNALKWATSLLQRDSAVLDDFPAFQLEFQRLFGGLNLQALAATRLEALRQGKRTVADYAIEFQQLALDTEWNDAALRDKFQFGLTDELQDELVRLEPASSLRGLIEVASRIDERLRIRAAQRGGRASQGSSTPREASSPRKPLTDEEKERRRILGLCLYCASKDHLIRNCPERARHEAGKGSVQSR